MKTIMYLGHLINQADISEIDQTASEEMSKPEIIVKRFCLSNCPNCNARSFEKRQNVIHRKNAKKI